MRCFSKGSVLAALLLFAACSGDDPVEKGDLGPAADTGVSPADSGVEGLAVDAGVDDLAADAAVAVVPHRVTLVTSLYGLFFEVKLDGKGPFWLRYDTGAPFSFFAQDAAAAQGLGAGQLTVEVGGKDLGQREFKAIDHNPEGPYPDVPGGNIIGTVGNSFFAGYSVGLNFRDQELWITETQSPTTDVPRPQGTEQPISVAMTQPLGYLVVPCAFEDAPPSRDCLFDTGSPDTVAMLDYWQTFAHPSDWIVPTFSWDVYGTLLEGFYQRSSVTVLGEFRQEGDYVAVFGSFAVIDSISKVIGGALDGIIGITPVFGQHTVIDYENDRMLLFPYTTTDHLRKSPFVGLGFVVTTTTGYDLVVYDVVPKSQAASSGIKAGDTLALIDGISWTQYAQLELTIAGIISFPEHESHEVTIVRDSEQHTFTIVAEDLLPPLE